MKHARAQPDGVGKQEEFGLLELLIFFARYKIFLVSCALAGVALALVFALTRPDVYIASARLLPIQETQFSSAALASELGGFDSSASVLSGGKTTSDLYAGILKSNKVLDALISTFDLKKVYGTTSQETARMLLKSHTAIVASKDGFLFITVKDQGRVRVAQLVNAYCTELDRLSRSVAINLASQQRQFYQRELAAAGNRVAAAEKALQQNIALHGVDSGVDRIAAVADTIAMLKKRVVAQRISLGATDAFLTSHHPEYARARQQLDSLQAELDKLASSGATPNVSGEAGASSMPLMRALDQARAVYELLSAQNELTKMNIAEDVVTTQVLDAAITPEERVNADTLLDIWRSGLAAWIFAMTLCFIAEARRRRLFLITPTVDDAFNRNS